MSSKILFRSILASSLLAVMFSFVASITLSDTLPIELQSYLEIAGNDLTDNEALAILISAAIFLILAVVSTVGLWSFKKWARTLHIVGIIISLLLTPILSPVIMNGWEVMFSDISLILGGLLLAMMFSGEVGAMFRSEAGETTKLPCS